MLVSALHALSTEHNQGVVERLADATKAYTAASAPRAQRAQCAPLAAGAGKAAPPPPVWPPGPRAAVQKAKALKAPLA